MREKAKDLLGDFQAVVGGWPSSLSWGPAPTRAFGLSKCILRKKLKQVIDPGPGFSSSAPKANPCTRNASETAGVSTTALGITPAPLVFWGLAPKGGQVRSALSVFWKTTWECQPAVGLTNDPAHGQALDQDREDHHDVGEGQYQASRVVGRQRQGHGH